jgi:hypothetical protein
MADAATVKDTYIFVLGQAEKSRTEFVRSEVDLAHFAKILSRLLFPGRNATANGA